MASPICNLESVSASLLSLYNGTLLSFAFSIIRSATSPFPVAKIFGAVSPGSYASATAVFPGLSGTGMTLSYSVAKGADTENAVNWATLLVIPAMVFAVSWDVFLIFGSGIGTISVWMVAGSVLAGISAFCGGYVGISILRLIAANSSVFQFSYYSFGAALLTFVIYLLT